MRKKAWIFSKSIEQEKTPINGGNKGKTEDEADAI